ncbi:MAG: DNA polymerase III subunit beta [Holophagaceae bacterium]|nr:DNA polymerase III subunit beta [Holophagaceae bacterium]
MNFQLQVSRERLDRVLGVLKHALEKKVTLPILQHIVMDISVQEMTLKTTDMELAFEATLPIEGSGTKLVAVPGKKMVETIRTYPDGILTFEWPEEGNGSKMLMRAKGFNSEHNIQNAEGFPELPKPEPSKHVVKLPMALFKKATQLGAIATSKDPTKAAISGVLMHLTSKFIRIVSTDGFRLAVVEFQCDTGLTAEGGRGSKGSKEHSEDRPTNVEEKIIVPKRAMDIICSSFDEDTPLELSWDDRSLFVHQPNLKFSTRRVTANYPAYEKVLPAELPHHVVVDREEFIKILRFVGLKKDDYNKNVRLFFEFPNLRVMVQHPDEGINQASLNFSGAEQPLELAFNIDYLTELMDKLPGDEVEYQFKDDVGQGVFMSPSLQDMSFKYILMPVKFASPN